MPDPIDRREALTTLGAVAGSLVALPLVRAEEGQAHPLGAPETYEWRRPASPVTAAIMGAGSRGNGYASYAAKYPEELKIVGVAEPIPHRNETMAVAHGIPAEQRWDTWERAFDGPRFCDAIIITTPDHLHYGPAMAALERGYDLLLEKAIAQSWAQCRDIFVRSQERGAIVGVCHVMRYSPYFRMLKHVVDSGRLGDVVSVQHLEPVEHIHMSHSFVRGNWRNTAESNPILLSKSCHDLDILRWILGRPCRRVQSFGSLSVFRSEMKPAGATLRCADGCAVEPGCPFSALRIYVRGGDRWLHHKDTPGHDEASILEWLSRTNYGRCVYQLDNDVLDHQTVNMEFDGGITAAFSMEGLTSYGGRRTRIMGTRGDLVGDEKRMDVYDFSRRERHEWVTAEHAEDLSGHGGGDFALVRDWVQAVSRRDESLLTSNLAASMESHLIGFTAEESRHEGGTLKVIPEGELPG
ncbi:MAG: Gfo/Idh/MocA family oxidoreductase [Acidobacteria bacterium]|nr:Gfo/Idh/MocA family oxidoreductase [Acidobacteriota bacterium]